jgi:arylformamidase
MKITLTHAQDTWQADLEQPIDISIPLRENGVNCFYAPPLSYEPVKAGNFIGDTRQGGVVNFMNVRINPHGNGTHTECVGHIALERLSINECLKKFHFLAQLVSIYPQKTVTGDRIIFKIQLQEALGATPPEAVIIRTMPNDDHKLHTNYSGSNPPYLDAEGVAWLAQKGVQHLLVDIPSVDRAEDGGQLLAHKAFWNYPHATRKNSTITELIYVPNFVKDGLYLLQIQIAGFEIDVSPSKPILYAIQSLA